MGSPMTLGVWINLTHNKNKNIVKVILSQKNI